ncbi:hypothetical protein [Nonomuraea ceibae]|nr:hypothetical protein [Nonomuraea ceibae]
MDYTFLAHLNHNSLNPRARTASDPATAHRPSADPEPCAEEAEDG